MTTLISARWVLPVTTPPIAHGAVLIDADGRITEVGPATAITAQPDHRIDLGEAALLPGLVNVHAHPELAAFRGLLDDLPFHLWIPALMRCKRGANLTDEDHDAAARFTCLEAMRAGITTIAATETSGAAVGALAESGMRGRVYLETFGPDPDQVAESIAELRQRIARFAPRASDRVSLGISPHAPYTVSDALYAASAALARAEGLPLATHASEAEAEHTLIAQGSGPFAAGLRARGIATEARARSTIELLYRLGVLDARTLLIHCVRTDGEDLMRIADQGAAIAHCPIANARLGHGVAPIVEARAAGIPLGLGTDSVASNNRLDLLEEARCAQIVQRARLQSSGPLPGPELLRLATLDGARALGLESVIGSLDPGKDADLCAVALDHVHTIPAPDIENAIFHAARGTDVILSMVQGRVLYDGTARTLNAAELSDQVRAIAERLQCIRNRSA